jgi:hypothetical protein
LLILSFWAIAVPPHNEIKKRRVRIFFIFLQRAFCYDSFVIPATKLRIIFDFR